jgi:hypothetical protein
MGLDATVYCDCYEKAELVNDFETPGRIN